MFTEMLDALKLSVVTTLSRVQVRTQEEMEEAERLRQELAQREAAAMQYHNEESQDEQVAQNAVEEHHKIGRNEPCPCGSGKKYKHCHGSRARH